MAYQEIAVIGIGLRVGDINDTESFINLLANAKSTIGSVSEKRRKLLGLDKNAEYIKYTYMEDIEFFDNEFFGINKAEADYMNPEQRIILETAYEAVWDAGYSVKELEGSRTSVVVSLADNGWNNIISEESGVSMLGDIGAVGAGRIAYQMNLHGPVYTIDTTCSSSLSAIHNVCMHLQTGEADMGLAGGINVLSEIPLKSAHSLLGIASSDGNTRSFDDSSDGTGGGEAVGVVLLKRLSDAIRDNDNIYAVIKSSSMNSDGNRCSNIASPSPEAQSEVIYDALKKADISPETIRCIEAHGTGTRIGDPIEVKGVQDAFSRFTEKKQFCGLTAIKSNIGHTVSAAGVLSFIKAVLSVQKGYIFPICGFNKPNSLIDFSASPLYPVKSIEKWNDDLRRCGVSSFGLSGTNVHIIVENYNKSLKSVTPCRKYVFNVSAKTKTALKKSVEQYSKFVKQYPDTSLGNLSYVMNKGRDRYKYNISFVADSLEAFSEKIIAESDKAVETVPRKLILLCSGDNDSSVMKIADELKEKGVVFNSIFGNGRGNIIVSYLAGKIDYNTAVKNYNNYEGDVNSLDIDRFKKALLKISENSDILFAGIGKNNFLISTAKDILGDSQKFISYENSDIEEFICSLYLNGADIIWDKYYSDSVYKRISIPVYPFDRTYCWPKNIKKSADECKKAENQQNDKQVKENVRDIWKEVIGIDDINDDDDFYSLGGSSIMHMQIISRVRELMNVELSFEDLEDYDTIELLTECIESKIRDKNESIQCEVNEIPRNEKIPLSCTQKSMICIYENFPDSSAYNMSASFKISGDISVDNIEKSFCKVVNDNEILRTVYKKDNGEYYQKITDGSSFSVKKETLSDYIDEESAYKSIISDTGRCFDLNNELPIRVHFIELSQNQALLSVQLHHICADSWSATIIIKEFLDNYEKLMRGIAVEDVPDNKLGYADYALWQRELFESDEGKKKIEFWRNYLKDAPPYLKFPLSKPRTGIPGVAKICTVDFGTELSQRIKEFTLKTKLNTYEFMLALYGEILYRYSHQTDFCVGIVTANRMRREFENVVGFFANTLVLRFKINSDMGFSEFAISVKHTIKELFDNQDIPFEYVVNEIAPIRNPLYSPVFQHVFTMRSFSTESDVKGCISMEELENYNTDAKFDFVFILSQSESSGDISVSAEYDNALFSESEIIELLQNYKIAANAVISSPDEPIGTVSLTQENVTELNSNCDEEMYDF